ncbi:helix-turn-helix transcriptional regulator [Candidatus Dependentiae bacterium]|nr:helix-turn-helix transcriptional regulator [Candidatus Dependentiae bacterium]
MVSTRLRVKELLRERRWTTKVLAEKTGMSESYLTHIKNGTRRWNEDALRKLAEAFELDPSQLLAHRPQGFAGVAVQTAAEFGEPGAVVAPVSISDFKLRIVPVVGAIPSEPSAYNNQLMQVTSGYKDVFVPVFGYEDDAMFCLCVDDNSMAPNFIKGDFLIIAPSVWTRSGDVVAVEYGNTEMIKDIMTVNYMDDFILLESVNHRRPPIPLVKGKDSFRIIGKLVYRYQRLG